jgi:hypothetical protein
MRKELPHYYRPTEQEFTALWAKCIFAFDANMLLNIYRYTPQTRERFLTTLEKLKSRIWLPYQAAYEYQENRLLVIAAQHKVYEAMEKKLEEQLSSLISGWSSAYSRHPFIDIQQLTAPIQRAASRVRKELEKKKTAHPDYIAADELRDRLDELFAGKVGKKPADDELDRLHKEGAKRYGRKQPPGYKDDDKQDVKKYGDYVLWSQLINHAKAEKKPLVLVTDDRKEDWWLRHEGRTIGPRPQLIEEMKENAGIKFYMYQSEQFLEQAGKHLRLEHQQAAIEEVQDIRKQDDALLEFTEKMLEPIAAGEAAKSEALIREQARLGSMPSSVLATVRSSLIPEQAKLGVDAFKPSIPPNLRFGDPYTSLHMLQSIRGLLPQLTPDIANLSEVALRVGPIIGLIDAAQLHQQAELDRAIRRLVDVSTRTDIRDTPRSDTQPTARAVDTASEPTQGTEPGVTKEAED